MTTTTAATTRTITSAATNYKKYRGNWSKRGRKTNLNKKKI